MNELNFCYWLQGFFEINSFKDQPLSVEQVRMIKDHLQYVFDHRVQTVNPVDHNKYFVHNTDPLKYTALC